MSPPLLSMRDIRLSFGGTPLFEGGELGVAERDRICLVGRNGVGKSTFLKIAAGEVQPDRGERIVRSGTTMRYLAQEPDPSGFATIGAFVAAGLAPGDDEHVLPRLLADLGLCSDTPTARLSGGEAKRAAIAQVLAPSPDILLLDEPTNHLDLDGIEWLEAALRSFRGAIVMISHDRRFLENLSNATVWIESGRTRRLDRGFSEFESWRDALIEREESELHKLGRKIKAEENWLYYGGVTARRRRNMGRVRALDEMRQRRRDAPRAIGDVSFSTADAGASGKLVIEARNVTKRFGTRIIVEDFSIRIARGDRIGIVGPNGTGKTTLVKLLTGAISPDAGEVRVGANVAAITLDQRREALDPDQPVGDAITSGRGDYVMFGDVKKHVATYMREFLFTPEQIRTPVGVLSGGERGRLMLARALSHPSNLLILDEPTNDLDLETLDLLQEMLADYSGTVLLVSHDRDFLDRVVGSVIAFEGGGRWIEYAGGYSDLQAQRKAARKNTQSAVASGRGAGKPATATSGGVARGSAPRADDAVVSTVRSDSKAARTKTKLSFREKHDLETLPAKLDGLAGEIRQLEEKLSRADFYSRDPEGFARSTARLSQAQGELSAAEERWLELEMLREELEG